MHVFVRDDMIIFINVIHKALPCCQPVSLHFIVPTYPYVKHFQPVVIAQFTIVNTKNEEREVQEVGCVTDQLR